MAACRPIARLPRFSSYAVVLALLAVVSAKPALAVEEEVLFQEVPTWRVERLLSPAQQAKEDVWEALSLRRRYVTVNIAALTEMATTGEPMAVLVNMFDDETLSLNVEHKRTSLGGDSWGG